MEMTCWNCGTALTGVIMPLSRRETCTQCHAELHTCRQCLHFDPAVSDQCREDRAEQVREKDRANFCDYFALNSTPQRAGEKTSDVSPELAALFGLPADGADHTPSSNPLDALFKDSNDDS